VTETVYVYGVVPRDADPDLDSSDVRLVRANGVAALVSDAEDAPVFATRENLTEHARILQEAMDSCGAVLPMRFGIVMPESVLRSEFLDRRAPELSRLIDQVTGRVELNLRGFWEEEKLLREVVESEPALARRREEVRQMPGDAGHFAKIELGEAVAKAVQARTQREQQRILSVLSAGALDVRVQDPTYEHMLVRAAFLIERAHVPQFEKAAEQVASDAPEWVRLKLLGPVPPHSFVELGD
jgi:hypothetical protein